MASRSVSLPSRLPVGTKFVIESRTGNGQISRFLEFPDGTHVALPARPPVRKQAAKRRKPRGSDRRG